MRHLSIVLMAAALPALAAAQRGATPSRTVPAAMSAITEADIRRDLSTLAGDAMRGREAGTIDEIRASMWIADQLRKIGLEPMGDDGTFFQWWSLRRVRLSGNSVVRVGDRALTMWKDIAATGNNQGEAEVTAPTVWAGDGSDSTIDVRGKVAVVQIPSGAGSGGRAGRIVTSPEQIYVNRAIQQVGGALTQRGAAAVILIADDSSELGFESVVQTRMRGTYAADGIPVRGAPPAGRGADPTRPFGTGAYCGGPALTPDTTAGRGGGRGNAGGGRGNAGGGRGGRGNAGGAGPGPVFIARRALLNELRTPGQPVTIRLFRESFSYPSVNIVGRIRGTDPALRDEYVLYSSHQDHDGVRYPVNGDSIWNGADDNGTVSVALLAAARAMAKQPPRRSILFVYHGADERGLIGSRYYVANPIVPLAKTVAVLNGDMLGRNSPDSASILGVQPPHMNSRELVAMALEANNLTGKFKLDSIWDRPTHSEGWYRRSDHLPYAEACVPAIEYSSNLHPEYHTPRDEPQTINYPKLTRIAQWMYLTGWFVANADKRPALEATYDVRR
jgi:hypothetical protein